MVNELLFVVAILVSFMFIMLSQRFGKSGLSLIITINLILVSVFAPKLISVFGLFSNVGNIFYGTLFIAINLTLELYGKKAAFKALLLSFTGNMLFIIMGQFVIRFIGSDQSASANDALSVIFSNSPRIAFASIFSYLVVLTIQILLYSSLKKKTDKYMWLRHIGTTTVSQFLDSCLFFTIAFYAILPNSTLLEAILAGSIIKTAIAVLGTPLLYIGKTIGEMGKESED